MRLRWAFAVTATITALLSIFLVACNDSGVPTSDQAQASQQERAAQEANAQAGFPGVTNHTEKKLVKMLYELRDKSITTYSYVPDMQGRLWHICNSIGFGLPYGVQYTNPEKVVNEGNGGASYYYHGPLPQPEPNGLFMPPSAEGTWVMCAAPGGKIEPIYVEPRVIVSQRKLKSVGSWQE